EHVARKGETAEKGREIPCGTASLFVTPLRSLAACDAGQCMIISKSRLLSTLKNAFRGMGLEIGFSSTAVNEENALRSLFREQRVKFVLDVGANSGQYGSLVRRCGFDGPIVSFEPVAEAHARLVKRAAREPNWRVAERAAVGASSSKAMINVTQNSVSSSLLRMNSRHLNAETSSRLAYTEKVNVIALDDCIDQYVSVHRAGLLKIDTQGYEIEVLRGADKALSDRIDFVQVELSLVELYDKQPLMLDVCEALKRYNFQLRHVIPGLKDPVDHSLLQVDGIF